MIMRPQVSICDCISLKCLPWSLEHCPSNRSRASSWILGPDFTAKVYLPCLYIQRCLVIYPSTSFTYCMPESMESSCRLVHIWWLSLCARNLLEHHLLNLKYADLLWPTLIYTQVYKLYESAAVWNSLTRREAFFLIDNYDVTSIGL